MKQEVTTRHDTLPLGAMTTVKRQPITIEVVGIDRDGEYRRVRVSQLVELLCEVLIPKEGGNLAVCELCGAPTPLPDASGAEYILANHDGGRICFPRPEAIARHRERDQYPVTGWVDVDHKLACPTCAADWKAFVAAKRGDKK